MNAREERNDSHATIKCSCCRSRNATMTTSRLAMNQRRKYAEVEYGEYAEGGVYITKGVDATSSTAELQ
jgi:hypothetical protein